MVHRHFLSIVAMLVFVLIGMVVTVNGQPSTHTIDLRSEQTPQPGLYFPLLGKTMSVPLLPPTPAPIDPSPGLSLSGFTTNQFSGPAVCNNCHANLKDEAGTDVTMATHWRSTMMANAARDPLFLAKVSSEIERYPEAQALIEETCSRCHMPMAYTQAVANDQVPSIFGDGFLNPDNDLHDAAKDGVSCTLCHQIQPDGLGTEESFSGHYVIDTSVQAPNRVLFGPYPAPPNMWASIMRVGSGYDPQQGDHITQSSLCAACHTLFTLHKDAEGELAEFPEQVPYLEWLHSDYGNGGDDDLQCQECHMPAASGKVSIFQGLPGREPFQQHYFVGGNVFMLRILQAHVEELGLRASTTEFADTIERTLSQLQNQTAFLSDEEANLDEDVLTISLHVNNKVGHKLPTGYPSRRLWLHVTVADGSDRLIFDSGRPLAHGAINGNDADLDPASYEPHYDLITQADQVQIYEAIMGNIDDNVTHTLLEAATYLKDNRILPSGFDKQSADEEVAVRGAAALDDNFLGGQDLVTYKLDVEDHEGPFTIRAELLYQSVSYQFVQDLRSEDTEQIELFGKYFDTADKSPVLIDSVVLMSP